MAASWSKAQHLEQVAEKLRAELAQRDAALGETESLRERLAFAQSQLASSGDNHPLPPGLLHPPQLPR